ncbi:uncharacterized protein LY79DRAFT_569225 [Colletotrichum navitas]|uniref:Uncharacterized protein n=1 Tax=Colletotrichum navitas TaxID=681940 RepID=A0AAD8PNL1_9PEZI|nr:uncharacterized protein LY79DRAFT_569225 [Colletotrichum navitas]KAK1573067.1 hypothetical protein LY79DRAFT_569225 [Colletotrichum navitas]
MRLFSITTLLFALASMAYAMLGPDTAGSLEAREPKRRLGHPHRPGRDGGCLRHGQSCSRDDVCCSGNCNRKYDYCD